MTSFIQKIYEIIKNKEMMAIVFLLSSFMIIPLVFNLTESRQQQFSYMAKSFLSGKLYLTEYPGTWLDTVKYNDHYYWPLGPFPSLLLVPFVGLASPFGIFFYQGYLQFFITMTIFYICFWLAKQSGYTIIDSLYLGFAFVFASVYQWTASVPWSWYFSQSVTVLLLFLAFVEYFTKKRYWLIGTIMALTFATRFTAGLGILFFVLDIFTDHNTLGLKKIKQLSTLLTPVIITGLILLAYNSVRFNDPFDNGYRRANAHIYTDQQRFELINYGLFQLRNIPTNFYYYFIKTVDPVRLNITSLNGPTYILTPPYVRVNYPGVSFFVVSPIFLYIFRADIRRRIVRLALAPIFLILFALLTYYWPGWTQIGPRYTLDFLPLLFIILLFSFQNQRLPLFAKIVITSSAYFNLFLFFIFAAPQ